MKVPSPPVDDFCSSVSSLATSSVASSESSTAAEARRLMDVELMHRWSTVTYKSFVSIAEDHAYLQEQVPLAAFKHDYLLNGILALTALEKALTEATRSTPPADDEVMDEVDAAPMAAGHIGSRQERHDNVVKKYVHAGLDYYDKAIRVFRTKLSGTIGPEDQHPLFFMSLVAPIINLITPQCLRLLRLEAREGDSDSQDFPRHSALTQASAIFELLNGMTSIVSMDWGGIVNSPVGPSLRAALKAGPPDLDALDADTKEALKTLMVLAASLAPSTQIVAADDDDDAGADADGGSKSIVSIRAPAEDLVVEDNYDALINGRVSGPLPNPQPSQATRALQLERLGKGSAPPRTKAECRRDMYMNEVFYLRYIFAETQRAVYKFSGIGWPCMCGYEFTRAVGRREPLALLLVAFWGVLLGRDSNSVWWMGSIGSDLVAEVSETLILLQLRGQLGDGFANMPEWRASLSWTRTQVGLPSLS